MISDFWAFVIAGMVLIVVPIIVIAYFQGGFFWPWLRARSGRGKYVLIKVRSKLRDYFKVGRIEEDMLIFKDATKEEKRISIDTDNIYRAWGVACCDFDEAKNAVMDHNFEAVSGFDAIKYNYLYVRALMRPTLEDNKTLIIILLLCFVLLMTLIIAYMVYHNGQVNTEQNQFLYDTILNVTKKVPTAPIV